MNGKGTGVGCLTRRGRGRRQGRGLTLIELLTVIAILAILASLLVPAISHALHRARSVKCRSNTKDVGNALANYVQTHSRYPRAIDGVPLVLYPERIRAAENEDPDGLEDVLKIARCPNAPRPDVFVRKRKRYTDYGYNKVGLGGTEMEPALGLGFKEKHVQYVREGDVASPAKMIAYGDGFRSWKGVIKDSGFIGRSPGVRGDIAENPDLYEDARKRVEERHSGHANLLFCDGHTERAEIEEVFFATNAAALSRWNRDNQPHYDRVAK